MRKLLTFISVCFLALNIYGQDAWWRMRENVTYELEGQFTGAVHANPFWLQANKHGMSSTKNIKGYVSAGIFRDPEKVDSGYNWSIGYGLQAAVAGNYSFFPLKLRQAYMDINYKVMRISIGSKERPMEMKNNRLSTGSQTFGINARPIFQARIELPHYWQPFRNIKWLGIKGHFGYGIMVDTWWQKNYLDKGRHYVSWPLYHSKAGYLRIGNEENFPLVFEGGLEWATTFGGKAYSVSDVPGYDYSIGYGPKQWLKAIYGGGSDKSDGNGYSNAAGNTLGSWLFSLGYKGKGWKIRGYYDHFFEDQSQLFLEYGWKDGLYGLELTFPKNRFVKNIVYEYIYTKDQSGPVYHDHTAEIPDQISGIDNYYNHSSYQGWQYWGQPIGNPLYYTALYADDGTLAIKGNRFTGHHIGIEGEPTKEIDYRVLYTHTKNYGRYDAPYTDPKYNNSVLCEINYKPENLRIGNINLDGWSAGIGIAYDHGKQIGNNTGVQITVKKAGWLFR